MGSYGLDYNPYPTVTGTGAPNDFERIDARPGAFGGHIATGLQQLGQGVQKASQEGFNYLEKSQRMDDVTHGAELHSWFSNEATNLSEEFLEKKGKAAKDALPEYKKSLQDLFDQAKSQAGNLDTQNLLQRETRAQMDRLFGLGSHHAATEDNRWRADTARESSQSYGNTANLFAIKSPAPELHKDPNVASNLFNSDQEARNFWEPQGYDGLALDQKIAENRGRNVKQIVESLTAGDSPQGLQRAISFYKSQEDTIDAASRVQIDKFLRAPATQFDGQRVADGIMGRGPGLPPGYAARTFQIESGGNPNAPATGSNKGMGQFGPAEERKYGITDANRTDPAVQSRALAMENAENHDQLARVLGREPNGADYYLAHQQGLGGAVMHLGHPDNPAWVNMAATGEGRKKGDEWAKAAIWGNMTPEMKARFPGGVDTVTSADFTRLWAQRFDGNGRPNALPDKGDTMARILNDPYLAQRPQVQAAALAHANKVYSLLHDQSVADNAMFKVRREDTVAEAMRTGNVSRPMTETDFVNQHGWEKGTQDYQTYVADIQYGIDRHAMDTMPENEQRQLVESRAPVAGASGFAHAAENQDKLTKAMKDIALQRRDDPAGSVGKNQMVKAALAEYKPADPTTFKSVAATRMSAQEALGIEPEYRSPITKQEALQLTAPLRTMLPGQERQVLTSLGQKFQQMFGENADEAFAYALRAHKVDAETAQTAARVMRKLGLGQMVTAAEAAEVDDVKETAAANRAIKGYSGVDPNFRFDPDMIGGAIETQPSHEAEGPQLPNVPPRAIEYLLKNPGTAGAFDKQFGRAGMAKEILEKYSVAAGAQ